MNKNETMEEKIENLENSFGISKTVSETMETLAQIHQGVMKIGLCFMTKMMKT